MKLIIKGEPKEIAALVLATQERREENTSVSLVLDGKKIAQHLVNVVDRKIDTSLENE